jgi:hypothetical protein
MSTISSGTTVTTAIQIIGDTTGNLAIATGSANTVAMTIDNSQNVSFANAVTYNGTVVFSGGLTGNGAGLTSLNGSNVTSGTIAVANGGTGQTTRQAAMDALAGAVTAGRYLRGDGTDVIMDTLKAADMTGSVAIVNGGTGSTTAADARTALGTNDAANITTGTVATARLASGTANSGTYLRGDQTWAAINASPAGLILQVQQSSSSSNQSFSSGSWFDISGLSVTITPSATANKILILAQFNGTASDNSANTFRLLRNGSEIYGSAGTNGGFRTWGNASFMRPSIVGAAFNIYDSPSSTSALTYKIQGIANNTWYINQNYGAEALGGYRGTVSLIAIEVKG